MSKLAEIRKNLSLGYVHNPNDAVKYLSDRISWFDSVIDAASGLFAETDPIDKYAAIDKLKYAVDEYKTKVFIADSQKGK